MDSRKCQTSTASPAQPGELPFGLDLSVLGERYRTELRWQLGRADREDLTIQLWIEMLTESSQ